MLPASPPSSRRDRLVSLSWYVAVGAVKTLAGYGLFAGLTWLGLHPQLALLIQVAIIATAGYRAHARLAFRVRGWGHLHWYLGVNAAAYGINAGLLAWLLHLGVAALLAQPLCLTVTVPLGYVLLLWRMKPDMHLPHLPHLHLPRRH